MKNIRQKPYLQFLTVLTTGTAMRRGLCTMCGQLPINFLRGSSSCMRSACVHWLNIDRDDKHCPIMSMLTQSYPCDTWLVCSTL